MCGEDEEEENALLLNGVVCKEGISFASQLPCVKIEIHINFRNSFRNLKGLKIKHCSL